MEAWEILRPTFLRLGNDLDRIKATAAALQSETGTNDALLAAAYELNEVVCCFLNAEYPYVRATNAVNAYHAALLPSTDGNEEKPK